MAEEVGGGCERCHSGLANTYKSGLPREVKFCDACWKKFCWARIDRPVLWEQNPLSFLTGFVRGVISSHPDDPTFRRREALRAGYRLRRSQVGYRASFRRSYEARMDDVSLISDILGEDPKKIRDQILRETISGVSALEARLQRLLNQDPVYTNYLENIPGIRGPVISAGLIGEIGVARTVLCWQHERGGQARPRLLSLCEHGKERGLDEVLAISRPSERVSGIRAFPTSSDLTSFFGINFDEAGTFTNDDGIEEPWYVAHAPSKGGDLDYDPQRKAFVIQHLGGVVEKLPNDGSAPWKIFYLEQKEMKAQEWRRRFATVPPPRCSPCMKMHCNACNERGDWQKVAPDGDGIWVCRCHGNGYWFGGTAHLQAHGLRVVGKTCLDLLFHTWRYIEGLDAPPHHLLAAQYLT